jgi:uncharacterized Zn finger protein
MKTRCPRCGGQLTKEELHTEQGVFDGSRCIMCGDVFDELILEHRRFQKGELTCEEKTISSDQDLVIDVDQMMLKTPI